MNSPESFRQSPERLRAQAIAALVPFMLDGSPDEERKARLAAEGLLDDYNAGTPKELQLATQIVALSWSALACLRTAVAAKNLSMNEMLRLQGNAIALDRACQKSTRALAARRKERAKDPNGLTMENWKWDEGVFQLVVNQALDKLTDANDRLASYMEVHGPTGGEPPKKPIVLPEQMTMSVLAKRVGG
jgi:hypothetical protein